MKLRQTWACKDGFVSFTLSGGQRGSRINRVLVEWMNEESMANTFLKGMDWGEAWDMATTSQELIDSIEEPVARFFMTHTKEDLYHGAIQRRIMLYPVRTISETVGSAQLKERGFWVEVEHPELGCSVTYPGEFIKTSESSCRIRRRAPLIGEHNQNIYCQELGLSDKELAVLKQARVI